MDGLAGAWWFLDTYVVEHTSPSGAIKVLDMVLPVGGAPPEHVHQGYDDNMLVIEGELVVRTVGQARKGGPGDWVCAQSGTPHAFRVVGGRPARVLIVHDRPDFAHLIHLLGEPAQWPGLPPAGRGPSPEEVLRVFDAHDVDVVGPSLSEEEAQSLSIRS